VLYLFLAVHAFGFVVAAWDANWLYIGWKKIRFKSTLMNTNCKLKELL